MDYLGLFLFIVVIVGGIALFRMKDQYKELPTVDEYLKALPHCASQNGIKCRKCNSKSIRNWGRTGQRDVERLFICNHCNTTLYRNN